MCAEPVHNFHPITAHVNLLCRGLGRLLSFSVVRIILGLSGILAISLIIKGFSRMMSRIILRELGQVLGFSVVRIIFGHFATRAVGRIVWALLKSRVRIITMSKI